MQTQVATKPSQVSGARPAKAGVAIVLFGRDSKNKPHAAAFTCDEVEAAKKAAQLMGFASWLVPESGRALASKISRGVIFGSGRARAPLVSRTLMAQLELITGPAPVAPLARAAETGQAGAGKAAGGQTGGPGGTPSGGASSKPPGGPPKRPTDWGGIEVGALVLATTGEPQDGWFECIVLGQQNADTFELRWRDWPTEPTIVRRRDNLGLLPPTQVE